MVELFFIVVAYLLGSIPFGLLVGKQIKGIDIREHGSGNLGATNVFRVVGKGWGICVLFLDALKGYCAVFVPFIFLEAQPFEHYAILLGLLAILGHSFPFWLNFKGGKGVATSLGVFLALAWKPTLLAFGIFWLVLFISRIISISSILAAVSFPIATYFLSSNRVLFGISLLLLFFILYTHRGNIQRLSRGEEKKIV